MLTKVFDSSHAGAPASLGNANGTLQALLDAILVNGYNSKAVTLSRSGSTVTANSTAHGFTTGQVLAHSGADQAEYNVEARITVVDSNSYTFTISGTPVSPATGTITAKVAPLGWSLAYSSGNDRSYLRPASSRGFYLNVSDGAATNYARVRMFETVTAAGVAAANGTNPTPADATVSGGGYFYNSYTTDAAVRNWLAYGNEKAFVLITYTDALNYSDHLYVGDLVGGHPTYGVALWARMAVGATNASMANSSISAATFNGSLPFVLRALGGVGVSVRIGAHTLTTGSQIGGSDDVSYATYGLYINRIRAMYPSRGVSGYLPGLWGPMSTRPLTRGDTFGGAVGSTLSGKTFTTCTTSGLNQFYIETSDNWE